MTFIQIIEFSTTHVDEVRQHTNDWAAQTSGRRTPTRATVTEDRDRPGTYLQIVEFPSYEAAMKNNELPETAAVAEAMQKLADGPPTFYNLDLERVEQD